MTANGALMKNAARQLTCWISHPPITGPSAVVMDVNPDQVPIARPRSASLKVALMMARPVDEGHARREDRRNQSPTAGFRRSYISNRLGGVRE